MTWQPIVELVALALLALGLIAFTSREIGRVKTGAEAAAKKAAADAERTTATRWSIKYRNLEVLRDLQVALKGQNVTVFGSSQEEGRFRAPILKTSDVDLMIEVDDDTFAAWAAKVYGTANTEHIGVGDPVVWTHDWEDTVQVGMTKVVIPTYFRDSPTREPRRRAAEEILGLGLDLSQRKVELDIFLFPHSFVREEKTAIPTWDGTAPSCRGRSFRDEVLAGVKLADLEPAE